MIYLENIIKDTASQALNVSTNDIEIIERLLGGRSNLMYLFKNTKNDTLYTFRIPGKNAEVFVDRAIEYNNLKLVNELNLNSKVVFFDVEKGYKISEYIIGNTLTDLNVANFYEKVAKTLHKLHNSKIAATNNYQPFKRLEIYENLIYNLDYKDSRHLYLDVKKQFLVNKEFLEDDKLVFCHGDSQTDNIIITNDNELFLLDWEFAGNNYAFYDIACFGDKDFNHAINLLEFYLGKKPSNENLRRLYLWRAFQCLQWHNVALYKHLIGLSEQLKIDFNFFADAYVTKAISFLDQANKYKI